MSVASPAGPSGEHAALAARLRTEVSGEIRFDAGTRALYATDGSNYRQVPIGVVVPRTVQDAVAAIGLCHEHGVPILSRGAGTSLAGQCCNVAVVIDWSKYARRVVEIRPEEGWATVEPGTIRDDLDREAARHGLTFAPDTATHQYATVGGMIGNNSCGVHSVMGGKTEDNVLELDVMTADGTRLRVGPTAPRDLDRLSTPGDRTGQIYAGLRHLAEEFAPLIRARYPDIPRRVSGYNLPRLLPEHGFDVARALVGTEGTCVAVLEAKVRLIERPRARSLVILGYPDVAAAADDVPAVLAANPIGLEGLDHVLVEAMRRKGVQAEGTALVPAGRGWLLVEFGGHTRKESEGKARALMAGLRAAGGPPSMRLLRNPAHAAEVWRVRESALAATARVPGMADTWEGWEDAAVPPLRLGDYLREFRALLDRFGYGGALYGHFGQGCVHTRTTFELRTPAGVARYRAFVEEAADLVVSYGGSLSGEHGDGQSRAELLPRMFGPELVGAFGAFKALWDPDGLMNPGKVVDPNPLDADLRVAGPRRWEPATRFGFRTDGGSFVTAAERCVGVGRCRKEDTGVMCPSYMVTREERHSTRGRARLLFEMAQGEPISDGWRSEPVKEALDLCLGCKACRSECPVQVDMATYKAEFLSHHFQGRLRPRQAYATGLIHWWARLGSLAPGLANTAVRRPVTSAWIKRAAGVAGAREIPRLARQSFRAWFAWTSATRTAGRRGGEAGPDRGRVILWPDTFSDRFDPEPAIAATEVLESEGFQVVIPSRVLCCGRPLFDHGMLDLAARVLRRTVASLDREIRAGTPVVGVEPSCVAVFRDELTNLLPDHPGAAALSGQTFTLAEFLERHGWRPPALEGTALVQAHCHHRAVMGFGPDERMLRAMGIAGGALDAGCCGMAGSFGFADDTYEVARAVGERRLFPAIRGAGGAMVVADGFSCRIHIEQATGRRPLHLAQVLRMAGGAWLSASPAG